MVEIYNFFIEKCALPHVKTTAVAITVVNALFTWVFLTWESVNLKNIRGGHCEERWPVNQFWVFSGAVDITLNFLLEKTAT